MLKAQAEIVMLRIEEAKTNKKHTQMNSNIKLILEASSDASLYGTVAEKYGISKFLIAKWKRSRDALKNVAVQRHKNF